MPKLISNVPRQSLTQSLTGNTGKPSFDTFVYELLPYLPILAKCYISIPSKEIEHWNKMS